MENSIKFNPDLESEAGKLYQKYCEEKGIECRITAAANFCLGYMAVKEADSTLKAQQGAVWMRGAKGFPVKKHVVAKKFISHLNKEVVGTASSATGEMICFDWGVSSVCLAIGHEELNELIWLDESPNAYLELKARADKAIETLRELCWLKKLKETQGKCPEYLAKQPITWEKAFEVIATWNQPANGQKKEGEPVKEIEYMPILSAELRELRMYTNVPVQVPMHLLSNEQADRNHGQTLKRLKERGGLGVKEAISLITCNNWSYYRDLPMKEAIAMLNDLINNPQ